MVTRLRQHATLQYREIRSERGIQAQAFRSTPTTHDGTLLRLRAVLRVFPQEARKTTFSSSTGMAATISLGGRGYSDACFIAIASGDDPEKGTDPVSIS